MGGPAVEVDYSAKGDLLWLGNGIPNSDSAQNITFEPDFDAFLSADGKCVGVYLFDAARILLPQLNQNSPLVNFRIKELSGTYSRDTDTLTIGNGDRVTGTEEVAKGFTSHRDESGQIVGLTLEQAGELLLPYLQMWNESATECLGVNRKQVSRSP